MVMGNDYHREYQHKWYHEHKKEILERKRNKRRIALLKERYRLLVESGRIKE